MTLKEQLLDSGKPINSKLRKVEFKGIYAGLDQELELSEPVYVNVLPGNLRLKYDQATAAATPAYATWPCYGLLVCFAACDEHGHRLFSDGELAAVNAMDNRLLACIAKEAEYLNLITRRPDEEGAEDPDVKN